MEHVIGLTCVNCGREVTRPDARGLAYATAISLTSPAHVGETAGVATVQFAVMRPGDDARAPGMLLCDGCMGAAVRGVCKGILSDMGVMRGEETKAGGRKPRAKRASVVKRPRSRTAVQ